MQLLPSPEHPLCGRLGRGVGRNIWLRPRCPGHAAPSQLYHQACTCSRLTLKSRDSSLLVSGV